MTVRLPDGGLAQIQYSGNVPPRVSFAPQPLAAAYDGAASPFAMFERISAQMDRDMDAFMSDVPMGRPLVNPDGMLNVDMRNVPAGTVQYSTVSTVGGNGNFCSRSVEITRAAPGERPHVVKHEFGDCQGVGNMRFGATAVAPQHRAAPPIEASAEGDQQHSAPKLLSVAYQPMR